MGERGPPPTPTILKIAAGNPGRRELNDSEPVPPPGAVVAPSFITGRALEVWNIAAPVAMAMKVLTMADVLAFGRYCVAFARYLDVNDLLAEKGRTYERWEGTGEAKRLVYVGERPEAAEWRKLHEILIRLEKEFGLTASARSRIRVEMGTPATGHAAEDAKKRDFFRQRQGA